MEEKYTVLIAEDHLIQRSTLEDYCSQLGWIVVESVSSGPKMVKEYKEHKPDLILLDINLDKEDGIAAVKQLRTEGFDPNIIFVTGSLDPEHFKAGFELNSIDYVTKPYSIVEIEKALNKVKVKIEEKRKISIVSEKEPHFILAKQKRRNIPINEANIVYIERIDGSTKIIMNDGSIIDSTSTLLEIIEQATDLLFKPHRSFIINTSYIKKIDPDVEIYDNFLVRLNTDLMNLSTTHGTYQILDSIPLTRRQYQEWMQRLVLRVR